MLGKKIMMGLLLAAIISMAMADEQKPQPAEAIPTGRQMNWNSQNFLDGSASMMAPQTGQAKSSSGFQSFAPQSLESDINRDGSYSAASSGGGDYGYEALPDSSYSSGSSYERNGYDYQQFLPTTSRPFYSRVSDQSDGMTIPNAYLRGIPRNQLNQPDSYLSSLQSGRQPSTSSMSPFYSPSASNVWFGNGSLINSNKQHMTNRAGYDEDIPLGGVSSSTSNYGLLSGTTMRNSLSRQDDFSYGTVNGPGLSSIPPAGVGYGGLGFASPGYSSNYASPSYSSSYSSYGTPAYSYGGGYGANNYGYSPAAYSSYGSSYRNSPLYSNFGSGGAYGYGSPSYYKAKPRKGFWGWWKGKDVIPYTYGASIGGYGGAGYDAYVPYDHDQFDPGFWKLSKYAFKSMFRSMFKPIFKWLPLCSPFNYYYDREGQAEDSKVSSFVSALTAFLPIGLFMAAIVPNIITVSSGRRRRSAAEEARAVRDEATFPILDMISTFGVRALQEPECQSKVVCEIGRMGGLPEANTVQRALWLTANYVPERMSRLVGLDKLFRQIRSQQCSDLKCSSG